MGLLDQAMGAMGGKGAQQGGQNPIMSAVLGLIGDKQSGGLPGLIQRFQQHGLGDQVASWVGKGQNLPVSGGQIEEALGSEKVERLARDAGCSKEQVSNGLAENLPQIIDKLTPDGQLPEGDALGSGNLGSLAGKFFSH
jgi:uncharacterized protein YidB (DUF937 family)